MASKKINYKALQTAREAEYQLQLTDKLLTDTQRIDWLEANEYYVQPHREGDEIWWTVMTRMGHTSVTHPNGSWRAAVDAAYKVFYQEKGK